MSEPTPQNATSRGPNEFRVSPLTRVANVPVVSTRTTFVGYRSSAEKMRKSRAQKKRQSKLEDECLNLFRHQHEEEKEQEPNKTKTPLDLAIERTQREHDQKFGGSSLTELAHQMVLCSVSETPELKQGDSSASEDIEMAEQNTAVPMETLVFLAEGLFVEETTVPQGLEEWSYTGDGYLASRLGADEPSRVIT